MNIFNKMKRTLEKLMNRPAIEIREIVVRAITIILVGLLAYYSEDIHKQLINVIGFLVAFVVTMYYRKHFFPYLALSIFFYLSASMQELWNEEYVYQPITRIMWTMGNIFFPLGILNFIYRLYFSNTKNENHEYESEN